jgi:hypothetical protein
MEIPVYCTKFLKGGLSIFAKRRAKVSENAVEKEFTEMCTLGHEYRYKKSATSILHF